MQHILFIGNSHTYYNDMPDIFRRICKWNGRDMFCVMLAHGNKDLRFHRNEPEAVHNIIYGGYDYVVFQDMANPFDKDELMTDGVELAKAVRKSGAHGIAYMAWPMDRKNQQSSTEGWTEFAKATGFSFAPAGEAWWKLMDDNEGLDLFRPDRQHATKKGSYLAACVIYCACFDERPKTDGEEFHEKCAGTAYDVYLKYKV